MYALPVEGELAWQSCAERLLWLTVGLGGWLEADLAAEGFEFRDQAAGFPFGAEAAGEEVGAELSRGAKPNRRRRAACAPFSSTRKRPEGPIKISWAFRVMVTG
jgi:hypothetical protein